MQATPSSSLRPRPMPNGKIKAANASEAVAPKVRLGVNRVECVHCVLRLIFTAAVVIPSSVRADGLKLQARFSGSLLPHESCRAWVEPPIGTMFSVADPDCPVARIKVDGAVCRAKSATISVTGPPEEACRTVSPE